MENNLEQQNKSKSELEAVRQLFEKAEKNVLAQSAMWMRYNIILSQLTKLIEAGASEENINWKEVNRKLYTDVDPYDNNMYTKVHSMQELQDAREQCIEASALNLGWRKEVCKDCGKEFTLLYSECQFFENKGLNLPKRCKCCRDKRKQTPEK